MEAASKTVQEIELGAVSHQWRSGVKQWFTTNDASAVCDFRELFAPNTPVEVFTTDQKQSASESVILKGELNAPQSKRDDETFVKTWKSLKRDVVVKATFPALDPLLKLVWDIPPSSPELPSLEAEIRMYEYIEKLLTLSITPHLMSLIGVRMCTIGSIGANPHPAVKPFLAEARKVYEHVRQRYVEYMDTALKGDDTRALDAIGKRNTAPERLHDYQKVVVMQEDPVRLLILEAGRGKSLGSMAEKRALSDDALSSLVFQVLYTVHVLVSRGARHADLHAGNVFVDEVPSDTEICYFIPDLGMKKLKTHGYVAKLYDWDWGGKYPLASGAKEKLRSESGTYITNSLAVAQCDEVSSCAYNPKADAFTFLSALYKICLEKNQSHYEKTFGFVTKFVRKELLDVFGDYDSMKSRGGFFHRLCSGVFPEACPKNVTEKMAPVAADANCKSRWSPPDCYMLGILAMLDMFGGWSKDLSSYSGEPYVFGDWTDEGERRRILKQVGQGGPIRAVPLLKTGIQQRNTLPTVQSSTPLAVVENIVAEITSEKPVPLPMPKYLGATPLQEKPRYLAATPLQGNVSHDAKNAMVIAPAAPQYLAATPLQNNAKERATSTYAAATPLSKRSIAVMHRLFGITS